jgi:hypothetical protein
MADSPGIHQKVRHSGREYEVLGHRGSGREVWIVADDDAKWVPASEVEPINEKEG